MFTLPTICVRMRSLFNFLAHRICARDRSRYDGAGDPVRCVKQLIPSRIRCLSMPTIRVKENEPFEVALRRFKRTIEKSGLLTELRAREFYEKPTAERKRKKAAAIKRHYKRLRSMMLPKKLY